MMPSDKKPARERGPQRLKSRNRAVLALSSLFACLIRSRTLKLLRYFMLWRGSNSTPSKGSGEGSLSGSFRSTFREKRLRDRRRSVFTEIRACEEQADRSRPP